MIKSKDYFFLTFSDLTMSAKKFLEELPEHILVQILTELPFQKLTEIMRLNTYFYKIVITNHALNSQFRLKIDREKLYQKPSKLAAFMMKRFWKSDLHSQVTKLIITNERKYEHIRLVGTSLHDIYEYSSPESASVMKIVRKCSAHVKSLQVTREEINTNFLVIILNELPNLENFEFVLNNVKIIPHTCESPELKKLKRFKIHSIHPANLRFFLQIFEKVNTLEAIELSEVQIGFFEPFLREQLNLKSLKIEGRIFHAFLKYFGVDFPFKLKKLSLMGCHCALEGLNELTKFLNGQDELTSLNLLVQSSASFQPLLQTIISLPKLKVLHLDLLGLEENLMEFKGTNSSIQSLSIKFTSMLISERFVSTLIGLKSLTLSFNNCILRGKFPASLSFDKLPHLKYVKLEVTDDWFSFLIAHDVRMNNLKELKLEANGTLKDLDDTFMLPAKDWRKKLNKKGGE